MSTFAADSSLPSKPEKPPKPSAEAVAAPAPTGEGDPTQSPSIPRSVADIIATDAEDESLRRYKESLLGAAAKGDLGNTDDPRRVVITEFRVIFEPGEGHEDMVFNTDSDEGITLLKTNGLVMKEGCKYKFRISFRVQHDIVAGLTFQNQVRRAVFSNTDEVVLGSYPPSSTPHVFEFPKWDYLDAPSGMMFRGNYTAKNLFFDKDGVNHVEYEYPLQIKKGWV